MWRKNKRIEEEVLLFGDLIDRMKARIISGGGFDIDEDAENVGTMSTTTKGSDSFLRHGSDFLRHGVVHGSSSISGGSGSKVQIETAVGTLAETMEEP